MSGVKKFHLVFFESKKEKTRSVVLTPKGTSLVEGNHEFT